MLSLPKKVLVTPVQELQLDAGTSLKKIRPNLTSEDISNLLRRGSVQFVVADVGCKLVVIAPSDCFKFWKDKVKLHLAKPESIQLEDYPEEYAYIASEWAAAATNPVVLLEKMH